MVALTKSTTFFLLYQGKNFYSGIIPMLNYSIRGVVVYL